MESKPFASLTSGLLARKGHAKPAMRPQSYSLTPHEDLGWNDMGHQAPSLPPCAPVSEASVTAPPPAAPVPPVVRQQEEIAAGLGAVKEADAAPVEALQEKPAPVAVLRLTPVSRAKAGSSTAAKTGRSAFTLRIDPERHLKLRLACAVSHRSAQSLVTEALDSFLKTVPELDEIARGVARGGV